MALATPTVTTGTPSTSQGIQADRRVIDMRDEIYQYDKNMTPLIVTLVGRLNNIKTTNPKFQHLEDQPLPWQTTIQTAFANATATTFVVAAGTGSYFRHGDVVRVQTSSLTNGEVLFVVSVSTDTLTVIRNYAGDQVTGGTQAGSPAGSNVSIIGSASEEGSGTRSIKRATEASVFNYVQEFKDPFSGTNTLNASLLYGGMTQREYERQKFGLQHRLSQERAFLLNGAKTELTGVSPDPAVNKVRTTTGLYGAIATNVTTVTGSLTESVLETWCQTLFRYSSTGTKMVIAGRLFCSQLDLVSAGRIQSHVGDDTYGVHVTEFMSNHGRLMVAPSDNLINDFSGWAFALDMEHIFRRYMVDQKGDRDSRMNENIQSPDVDGWEDEYLSEVGLHITNEAYHGLIKGIT